MQPGLSCVSQKQSVGDKVKESWSTTQVVSVALQQAYADPTTLQLIISKLSIDSQQLKCNKLTLLASKQNAQQGRIHPAAEDLIEMQDAAFGAVPC